MKTCNHVFRTDSYTPAAPQGGPTVMTVRCLRCGVSWGDLEKRIVQLEDLIKMQHEVIAKVQRMVKEV